VILGGGDTGSDCLGTSNRQGAKVVHQFELMPRPPDHRTNDMPWPYWPMILRTSSSMGFTGPEKGPLLEQLGVKLGERGNVAVHANTFETSEKGVFACGDMQRGQSLVVWAIWEGRECARGVDAHLMGYTDLATAPHLNPLVLP
jgi:glutamate synthase (NADPH/NADH) small chain